MNQHQPRKIPEQEAIESDSTDDLKKDVLQDKEKQEQYRKVHLEQLRRRQCPGSGEGELF